MTRFTVVLFFAAALAAQDPGCVAANGALQRLAWWEHHLPRGAAPPPVASPAVASQGGSATEKFVATSQYGIAQTIFKLSRMPMPGSVTATVNGKRVAVASSGNVVAIPPTVGIAVAGRRMGKAYRIENVSPGDQVEIGYRW